MTETTLASRAGYLIEVAGRAPSLHNTQPWRFTVGRDAIDLHADVTRRLTMDPDGREMIISCGAALYGLRLAVRSLGRLPEVELLPEPRALARVRLGPPVPMTAEERTLLAAVPHRHTHRGPFEAGLLPAGLLGRLKDDARAEGARLIVAGPAAMRRELASSPPRRPADSVVTWRRGTRPCGGAIRPATRPGTACPRTPSPPPPAGKPGGYRSATSTSPGASACSWPEDPPRW